MAFLPENSIFPPAEWVGWFDKYNEWSSWYSGDPKFLFDYYKIQSIGNEIAQMKFWARIDDNERNGIVHLPAANDICTTSSNLLFSEKVNITYEENNISGERIKVFLNENGFDNLLLEGAELCAALSGCVLKLDIEPKLLTIPIMSIVTPNQFLPTFWRSRLWEILFFKTIKSDNSQNIWRLFENRRKEDNGFIVEYKLFKGRLDNVGNEIDINSIEELKDMNLEDMKYYNIDGLGCVYVPNMRPNKLVPSSSLGINDYNSELTLMDALDEAWTSWMRDLELGMAQIFIDEELITRNQPSLIISGSSQSIDSTYLNKFSKYKKAFTKLNLTQWKLSGNVGVKPIENIQFDIRVDEHLKTCEKLFYQIITNCGYSPQTFGLGDLGNVASGTALKILERKSQLTREKKSRYWLPAIRSILIQMQQFDRAVGFKSYEYQDITLEIQDSIINDSKEVSEVVRNLSQAQAASTYTKVKLQHPDWNDEKIIEEVDRILKESGISSEIFKDEV